MIDFDILNDALKNRAFDVLSDICPGGKLIGKEYTAASKLGGQGGSFKYNIEKMRGSDFATGETFGDIVSLYAAIKNIEQIESAKHLAETYCQQAIKQHEVKNHSTSKPNLKHTQYGNPAGSWIYLSKEGNPILHIARYNISKDKKIFLPWRFNGKEWECKAIETNRPMYKLPDVISCKTRVIVCEGEKAADACQKIFGDTAVSTTWSGGAKAINKTDFSCLKDKDIVIWPDADKTGIKAGEYLHKLLTPICKSVKMVDISGFKDKWDAFDYLEDGRKLSDIVIIEPKNHGEVVSNILEMTNKASLWKQLNLDLSENDKPYSNADNVLRILTSMPSLQGKIWFDEFHCKIFTSWRTGIVREWSDPETIALMIFIQRVVGVSKINKEAVFDAIINYSRNDVRNEPRDWMKSLSWDGVSRISSFFKECAGSEDSEYGEAVSRNFWISMIARIFDPGCKVDTMLILEGLQGTFKSTLFYEVGGKFYAEAPGDIRSVEFLKCLEGKMIVEFAELSSFSRAEVNFIKKIITCRTDRYRASYAKLPEDHPRTSIFTGTTNDDEYLTDPTGARRFTPIRVNKIDIKYIRNNREQLFAEAVAAYNSKEAWWNFPDQAKNEQEMRRIHDSWEIPISEYVSNKEDVLVSEVAAHIGIVQKDLDKPTQMRIAHILKVLGTFERKPIYRNGIQVRGWKKIKDETLILDDVLPPKVVFNE